MKLYYDTESEVYYTEKEMHKLYEENAEDIYLSCGAENYGQWLRCCTDKNGTIEEI